MKIVAVLLLCALACVVRSDEETKAKALGFANECKEETGATDDDVTAMMKHEPAGSTEAKCLRACVMKKFGLMSADGKLIKDGAEDLIKIMSNGDADKEALGKEILDACSAIDLPDDHCEAAAAFGACLKHEAHERGIEKL